MMLDQHHDDETLIEILEAGEVANDAHLRTCEDCTETLTALRDISSSLKHQDVWERKEFDDRPVGQTISMLRAAADRLQSEVGDAAELVDELALLPVESAERAIRTSARFQTVGVVRKLIENSEAENNLNPKRALALSMLAVAAADSLNSASQSAETLALLRGSAYRQYGFALYYAARYPEAMLAFDRADAAFTVSISGTYESGRVAINRTIVNVALERVDEAMACARQSQRAFSTFNDVPRLAAARFAEAYVLLKLSEWRKALAIFEAIESDSMESLEIDGQARVHTNIGLCYMQLGQNGSAAKHYYLAVGLFQQAGTKSEAARMHWHLAHLARAEGKTHEAVRRFDAVALEFAGLGMVGEAASTHLDTAETLLTAGEFDRVEELCRAAIRQYESSGLGYTSRALAALSYLGDVAKHRRATPDTVKHVRDYLRRLPQEPALLFAAPPENPTQRG